MSFGNAEKNGCVANGPRGAGLPVSGACAGIGMHVLTLCVAKSATAAFLKTRYKGESGQPLGANCPGVNDRNSR